MLIFDLHALNLAAWTLVAICVFDLVAMFFMWGRPKGVYGWRSWLQELAALLLVLFAVNACRGA